MTKLMIELSEYHIRYRPQLSLKIREQFDNYTREQWWVLYVNEASRMSRVGVGLVLHSPAREQVE